MNEEQESWQQVVNRLAKERHSSADAVFLKRSLADVDESADDLINALQFQSGLENIGLVQAPSSLHKKLVSIPNGKKRQPVVKWTASLSAAAAVFLMIFIGISPNSSQLSDEEINKARRDLATALKYLHFANNRTRNHVEKIIDENVNNTLINGIFGKSQDKT